MKSWLSTAVSKIEIYMRSTLKFSLLLASLLVCSHLWAQQPIADPVRDYLENADVDTKAALASTNKIIKLSLDINGDGKPVVFLSVSGYYLRKHGYIWAPYIPAGNGYTRANDASGNCVMVFDTSHLFVGRIDELSNTRGLVTYYGGGSGGDIQAYWFKGKAVCAQTIASFSIKEEDHYPPIFTKYFPNAGKLEASNQYIIQDISLDDLRSKGYNVPTSQWGNGKAPTAILHYSATANPPWSFAPPNAPGRDNPRPYFDKIMNVYTGGLP